jgi:hypothetical protein
MATDLPDSRRGTGSASGLLALLMVVASAPGAGSVPMHLPTFACANSGALRVTCVGSFVDGSSAAGITVRVFDKRDRVVYVGAVDPQGRISFRKPDAEFHIVFDAGRGTVLTIFGSEMT